VASPSWARGRSWRDDGTTGVRAAQHEVVAVDGLLVVVGSEDVGHLARVPASHPSQVAGRVVGKAHRETLAPATHGDGIAEREVSLHAHDPPRQEALPAPERVARPGVD